MGHSAKRAEKRVEKKVEKKVEEGREEARAEAREQALREIIADICEVTGVDLGDERVAQLGKMRTDALMDLKLHLKTHRAWP